MQIYNVPPHFQPHYVSHYPPYSSGKNIEEIIFELLKSIKDTIDTEYVYLPVFWTSYYILHNYKDESNELSNWVETLDKSKKYFTIVQFDSGIFVNRPDIDIDITVFSAGGGGLNTIDSIKEYEFHGMKRQFFNGKKGNYDIPLICSPQFPSKSIEKDIYCSFMGRFDTYFSRMDMKVAIQNNDKFKLFETTSYDDYCNIINRSIFTLAPRGYGFTSFRLYEAIFANSIPVYIWDNEISLPFSDEIKWEDFCIILHSSKINEIEQILQRADIPSLQKNLQRIKPTFTFLHTADYIIRKIKEQENQPPKPNKISLAIPHYNNTEFIMEAIEPALNDDRIGEIIICDDKSKDIDVLETILFDLHNPKIKLYKNQSNLGCYHNKLETVSKCSNKWTLLLDSDNIISKEFIDRLYEISEWNTNTIYAPSVAETFPIEPSDLLNYKSFANKHITPELYIQHALTNLNFICLINNCNYFLPTQEYITCMTQYTYERVTIDSLDSNVLFTDWLYNNNTVYIVDNLKYKHRVHSNSNHAVSHTCDEPTVRKMLVNKLLSMKKITVAVVKSEKYPDLWVSNATKDAVELFKTTIMRCPSIGLFEYFDTEFIIINDTSEYPCNIYSHPSKDELNNIHNITENKMHVLPFLDDTYHKHTTIHNVSDDMNTINWSKYNIVITINACIPDRIIEEFPKVLWCYYISENDEPFLQTKLGKYDILLNQDVNKIQSSEFSIGFPYTFLGPNTLETIYKQIYKTDPIHHGMFIEINNTQERPVTTPLPVFQQIAEHCNIPVYVHKQNILENLHTLCNSKYYIKIYGRRIRGNGVLEAISAGVLVLINKSLIMYDDLIPEECDVKTPEDIINKIKYFENNTTEYECMKRLQKQLLESHYSSGPANDLYNEYKKKLGR